MPVYRLSDELIFPPVHLATDEGLLAMGGDLSTDRLLLAYEKGIFPWYSEGDPILWWSPDPRLVLYPNEINISRSLKKVIRKGKFKITKDMAFEPVIIACAKVREDAGEGTWINRDMITAYIKLHQLGYAHSVEIWYESDLVGGLYGVCLGRCFFGESMFSTMTDASKIALVELSDFLVRNDFDLIDCQLPNDHLSRMGACTISRKDFLIQVNRSLRRSPQVGLWQN